MLLLHSMYECIDGCRVSFKLVIAINQVSHWISTFRSQVTEKTDFTELADTEPWLNTTRLVVKPDMLFGKRGKSGLVRSLCHKSIMYEGD